MSDDRGTPTTEPRIDYATDADAEEMVALLQAAFPSWPPVEVTVPAVDHLRWKMEGSPNARPRPSTVVREGDAIVAIQLRWLALAHVGDEVLTFDRGVDLSVHPDHRGNRLASLIFRDDRRLSDSFAPFLRWDLPPSSEAVLHLEDDVNIMRHAHTWIRTFNPHTALGLHTRAGARHTLRVAAETVRRAVATRSGRGPNPADSPVRIGPLERFDDRTDALWERARTQFDVARLRDAASMNWRFTDPRAGRSSTLAAIAEDGRALGYVVSKRAAEEGAILDLVIDPAELPAGRALLAAACEELRAAGCRQVRCLLPVGHPLEGTLGDAGFHQVGAPRAIQIGVGHMPSEVRALEVLRDPAVRIHITLGDFDFE